MDQEHSQVNTHRSQHQVRTRKPKQLRSTCKLELQSNLAACQFVQRFRYGYCCDFGVQTQLQSVLSLIMLPVSLQYAYSKRQFVDLPCFPCLCVIVYVYGYLADDFIQSIIQNRNTVLQAKK